MGCVRVCVNQTRVHCWPAGTCYVRTIHLYLLLFSLSFECPTDIVNFIPRAHSSSINRFRRVQAASLASFSPFPPFPLFFSPSLVSPYLRRTLALPFNPLIRIKITEGFRDSTYYRLIVNPTQMITLCYLSMFYLSYFFIMIRLMIYFNSYTVHFVSLNNPRCLSSGIIWRIKYKFHIVSRDIVARHVAFAVTDRTIPFIQWVDRWVSLRRNRKCLK